MIISFILVALLLDSETILRGEIGCQSLLGLKDLRTLLEVNIYVSFLALSSYLRIQGENFQIIVTA